MVRITWSAPALALFLSLLGQGATAQPAPAAPPPERGDAARPPVPDARVPDWQSLPPQERMRLWHSLSPEERMRMRESLSPEQREAWRKRWLQERARLMQEGGPHDSPLYRQLTPEERQRLREQIRQSQLARPPPTAPPPSAPSPAGRPTP